MNIVIYSKKGYNEQGIKFIEFYKFLTTGIIMTNIITFTEDTVTNDLTQVVEHY